MESFLNAGNIAAGMSAGTVAMLTDERPTRDHACGRKRPDHRFGAALGVTGRYRPIVVRVSDSTASPKPPPPPPPPPSDGAGRATEVNVGARPPDASTVEPPDAAIPPPERSAHDGDRPGPRVDDAAGRPPSSSGQPTPAVAPTPPPPDAAAGDRPKLRPGRMRAPWRVVLSIAWGVAILALSSVWQVSVQIGHSTWWLGPAGEPNSIVVQLLPFYGPIIVLLLIIINVRGLSWWAALFALGQIAVGAFDLPVYRNLGLLEITIGSLLAVISLASTAGRVGKPSAAAPTPATTA